MHLLLECKCNTRAPNDAVRSSSRLNSLLLIPSEVADFTFCPPRLRASHDEGLQTCQVYRRGPGVFSAAPMSPADSPPRSLSRFQTHKPTVISRDNTGPIQVLERRNGFLWSTYEWRKLLRLPLRGRKPLDIRTIVFLNPLVKGSGWRNALRGRIRQSWGKVNRFSSECRDIGDNVRIFSI